MNLTVDEILSMPAGREMDALIFEHVFGAEKGTFPVYAPMKSELGDYMVRPIQEYSSDISAAFEVVDKMRQNKFQYTLRGYFMGVEQRIATFDNQDWADANPLYKARGDTAALAICRAALVAVSQQETKGTK